MAKIAPKIAPIFGLWLVLSSTAIAEDITLRGLKPGSYTLEVSAAGVVTLTPTKLVTVGPTVPPTDPPGTPALTPFESAIKTLTKSTLTNEGGSLTTGAALSEVYSRVSTGVANGTIPPDQSLPAIKAATNLVLNEMPDKGSWTFWRTEVGDALTKLQQQGELTTKEQYASALKQVANGLNAATGYNPNALVKPGKGILGGIDIDKIIKLIELIMTLLKLFGV